VRALPLVTRADGTFDHRLKKGSELMARYAEFKKAWHNPDETWASLSKQFEVTRHKIARAAIKFGFPSTPSRDLEPFRNQIFVKPMNKEIAVAKRDLVLRWVAEHPDDLISRAPLKIRAAREWLRDFAPDMNPLYKRGKKTGTKTLNHTFLERDAEKAEEILRIKKQATKELRQPGLPRAVPARIVRYLAEKIGFDHRGALAGSKVSAAIAKIVERPEAYSARRADEIIAGFPTDDKLPPLGIIAWVYKGDEVEKRGS
jgi:hypothetical protein